MSFKISFWIRIFAHKEEMMQHTSKQNTILDSFFPFSNIIKETEMH